MNISMYIEHLRVQYVFILHKHTNQFSMYIFNELAFIYNESVKLSFFFIIGISVRFEQGLSRKYLLLLILFA